MNTYKAPLADIRFALYDVLDSEALFARLGFADASRELVDAILDAARTLLASEGVAGLSIYSVAERAQIPPSSVYHFFASVPALLEALTADVHAAFRAARCAGARRICLRVLGHLRAGSG